VRLPAPGSFPGVILSGATACVLGVFPSKNLVHTKHSAHRYTAALSSQTAGSFAIEAQDDVRLPAPGSFPSVILSGAKNLANAKPSAPCYTAALSSQTAGSFAIEAQDDVTLPAPGSFPFVILSGAKNLVHTKSSAHCYNASLSSQTARSFAEKAQDDVTLPEPGSFPGVILSGATACVLGVFPSKNLAHTKHSAHCYTAALSSQTARPFAIKAQDDVTLPEPGFFPGVILSGAKNLLFSKLRVRVFTHALLY
jgi:hypothetical protein